MVVCDVRYRAIPWVKLMLAQGVVPNDLNLKGSQRLSAVLACGILALLAAGAWVSPQILLLPLVLGLGIWAAYAWTSFRPISDWFKIGAQIGVCVFLWLLAALPVFGYLPGQVRLVRCCAYAATLIFLPWGFYRVRRVRNPILLVAAFSLHLLYSIYSSVSVVAGSLLYFLGTAQSEGVERD